MTCQIYDNITHFKSKEKPYKINIANGCINCKIILTIWEYYQNYYK